MEVRIGITHAAREVEVDLGDKADGAAIIADIEKALGEPDGVLWLTDRKGRRVAVPSGKIAFIEVNAGTEGPRVGFGVSGAAAK